MKKSAYKGVHAVQTCIVQGSPVQEPGVIREMLRAWGERRVKTGQGGCHLVQAPGMMGSRRQELEERMPGARPGAGGCSFRDGGS